MRRIVVWSVWILLVSLTSLVKIEFFGSGISNFANCTPNPQSKLAKYYRIFTTVVSAQSCVNVPWLNQVPSFRVKG